MQVMIIDVDAFESRLDASTPWAPSMEPGFAAPSRVERHIATAAGVQRVMPAVSEALAAG